MLDMQVKKKKEEIEKTEKELQRRGKELANVRLILFLFFVCLLALASWQAEYRMIFSVAALLMAVIFLVVAAFHSKVEEERSRLGHCLEIIVHYEKRAEGTWDSFPEDGSKFIREENEHLVDLNVLGKRSVFQFLNISRTVSGQRRLVHSLTTPPGDGEEWLKTQKAVRELKENFEFALQFQEKLGRIRGLEDMDFEQEMFPSKKRNSEMGEKITPIIGGIFAFFTDVSLVLACCQILPFTMFGLLAISGFAYNHLYSMWKKEEYGDAVTFSRIFGAFEDIYRYVCGQEFESERLRGLAEQLALGCEIIQKTEKMSALCRCRDNWLSYLLFNPLFSLNILVLFRYRRIRKQGTEGLLQGINALEEMEKLIALAGICWVKQEICLPEQVSFTKLEMTEVRHPLLPEESCVPNDFSCGEKILIITGSNMSGKSSFMRTVGINLALMNAGTYVNARAFRSPFLKIAASIGIQDDISRGISTFYGELMRIKKILEEGEKSGFPMMVFIDEIFKGTNYNDRIFGAKVVVEKLSKLDGIAMITTHDFELCELDNSRIENYHFAETYEENKIVFDYKIKEGRCRTTNARYLMERIGLLKR